MSTFEFEYQLHVAYDVTEFILDMININIYFSIVNFRINGMEIRKEKITLRKTAEIEVTFIDVEIVRYRKT